MTTYADPGYIASVVSHVDRYEAAIINALRDRVVHHFATAADRDAAIPSPTRGMSCYLLSTGEFQVYQTSTLGWTPPWNTAWGEVSGGYAQVVANQTGFSAVADITSVTVTFTAVKDRLYEVTLYLPKILQNTSAGQVVASITDGTPTTVATANVSVSAGNVAPLTAVKRFAASANGALLRKGRLQTTAGTCDLQAASTSPAFIEVLDVGPNAAPS